MIFPNNLGNADLHWAEKDFPDAVEAAGIKDFRLHETVPHPVSWTLCKW